MASANGAPHVSAPTRSGRYSVTRYEQISALPRAYAPLFALAGKTSIFHTWPWYQNLIATVRAPDEHLRIYAVDSTEPFTAPRAVLIMRFGARRAALGRGASTLSGFSNFYTSLFGPIMDPDAPDVQDVLDVIAQAIARDEMRWNVVSLQPLANDDVLFPNLVRAFKRAGLLAQTYFCFGNWYLKVNNQPFSEYIKGRPSRISKTGVRMRRKLEASGRFRFQLFTRVEGLDQGCADYNKVYNSSWKIPEPYPEFMIGLMRTCAQQGWLRLGVAYLDGEAAAAQIWTVVEGRASIYKMAYDERFVKDSIGTVLSSLLMEHVIDVDKVHEVDYLTGDDAYKKDWMSDRRERWGIVAYNIRSPLGLLAALRHLGGRAARRAVDATRRLRVPRA